MMNVLLMFLLITSYSSPTPVSYQHDIIGNWIWERTVNKKDIYYLETPKNSGFRKKIYFGEDNRAKIYKNNILIRVCKYELKKEIGIDNKEYQLINLEGAWYIIESVDKKHLTLTNSINHYSTIYRRD